MSQEMGKLYELHRTGPEIVGKELLSRLEAYLGSKDSAQTFTDDERDYVRSILDHEITDWQASHGGKLLGKEVPYELVQKIGRVITQDTSGKLDRHIEDPQDAIPGRVNAVKTVIGLQLMASAHDFTEKRSVASDA